MGDTTRVVLPASLVQTGGCELCRSADRSFLDQYHEDQTMSKWIQAIVVALAVAGSVSGCAVTSGQESTGQYVDDATITSRVKTRFAKDPTVSAMRISVETMQGVVQLRGFAKNQAERDQAGQLARSVS